MVAYSPLFVLVSGMGSAYPAYTLEMQVMFEEFVPLLRNPQFAGPVEYVRDYFVNSIKAMPISFDAET